MILKNITRKTVLAVDIKKTSSLVDKNLGLLKKSNPRSLFFETRFGIHTFFMGKAIDVLVLDRNYVVKVVKESLMPNNIFFYSPRFPLVIELPVGTIGKSKTRVGDRLKLTFGSKSQ